MTKYGQDSEIEFRYADFDPEDKNDKGYPEIRGLIVYSYGATAEKCIEKARKRFNLDSRWEVVKVEMPR
jgi:hypothetical protein